MFLDPFVPPADESADRGRCGVKNVDPMILDEFPKPIGLRPVRRSFVHERGGAVGEWTVDDVTMAGYPADIGGAPVDVVLPQIEHVFGGRINPDQLATGRVQNPFRFAGRSTGVKNVKRVLAIEGNGRAVGIDILHLAVPPDIALFLDVNIVAGSAKYDDAFDRV